VIAGKFEVEKLLGEGGMGYVVSARHKQLGQRVALKFMHEEVLTAAFRSRFLREARHTVRLRSKHVARVLDVGETASGTPYMVMKYLEGQDLSALLHARGPFPAQEACEYILQACEAIAEAHGHGIIHRDLKPANLFLLRTQGGEPVIKVLDFGVSKILELDEAAGSDDTAPGGRPRPGARHDSALTRETDLLGSPSYMAPEQIVSARDADAGSDLWSLGVILFRLLSGKAPFSAPALGELIQLVMHGAVPDLRALRPDLPVGLELVVARCLDRDRKTRIRDAGELARLLAPYAGPSASPSLERIALLGPALVTAPAARPEPSAATLPGPPSLTADGTLVMSSRPSRPSPGASSPSSPSVAPGGASTRGRTTLLVAAVFVAILVASFVQLRRRAAASAAQQGPPLALTPTAAPPASDGPAAAAPPVPEALSPAPPAPPPTGAAVASSSSVPSAGRVEPSASAARPGAHPPPRPRPKGVPATRD